MRGGSGPLRAQRPATLDDPDDFQNHAETKAELAESDARHEHLKQEKEVEGVFGIDLTFLLLQQIMFTNFEPFQSAGDDLQYFKIHLCGFSFQLIPTLFL